MYFYGGKKDRVRRIHKIFMILDKTVSNNFQYNVELLFLGGLVFWCVVHLADL